MSQIRLRRRKWFPSCALDSILAKISNAANRKVIFDLFALPLFQDDLQFLHFFTKSHHKQILLPQTQEGFINTFMDKTSPSMVFCPEVIFASGSTRRSSAMVWSCQFHFQKWLSSIYDRTNVARQFYHSCDPCRNWKLALFCF